MGSKPFGHFRDIAQRAYALIALVTSAMLLAGCNNTVGSEKPWFTKADADGSLRLKPGYWGLADCPLGTPPDCTKRQVEVTSSELHLPARWAGPQPDSLRGTRIAFMVVPGAPAIIQVEMHAPPELKDKNVFFFYAGFAPSRRDGDGQIIAGEVWPVVCGPVPRPGDENYGYQDDQGQETNHPLPGLEMSGGGCNAKDRTALISAARATRTMDGSPLKVEWKALTPPARNTR